MCSPSIAQSGSYCLAAVMAEMMDALVTASGPLVVRQAMHQSHGQFGFHGCKQIADLPLADGIRRRNRVAANVPVIGCSPSAKPNIESRRPCVRQQEDEEEDHDDDEHGGERQGWDQITPAPTHSATLHLICSSCNLLCTGLLPGGQEEVARPRRADLISSFYIVDQRWASCPTCKRSLRVTRASRTSSSASSYQSHCYFDCSMIWNENARITPLERNLF